MKYTHENTFNGLTKVEVIYLADRTASKRISKLDKLGIFGFKKKQNQGNFFIYLSGNKLTNLKRIFFKLEFIGTTLLV